MVFNQKENHLTGVAIKSADTNSFAGNVLILGIEQQVWIFIKHPQMAWWHKLSPNQFKETQVKSVFFRQLGSCSCIFSEGLYVPCRGDFYHHFGWRRLWWLVHHCWSTLESAGWTLLWRGPAVYISYLSCSMRLPQVSDEWVVSTGLAKKFLRIFSLTCYRKPEHISIWSPGFRPLYVLSVPNSK